MKMKKLIPLSLLLLLATSCEKESDTNDEETPEPVTEAIANFDYKITEFFPFRVAFENTSQQAVNYIWSFGDAQSSIEIDPIHEYDGIDSYSVKLEASDAKGLENSIAKTITHSFLEDPAFKSFPSWDVAEKDAANQFTVDGYQFIFVNEDDQSIDFLLEPKLAGTPSGQGSIATVDATHKTDITVTETEINGWFYTDYYFEGLSDITDENSTITRHYKFFGKVINNELDYIFVKNMQ